MRKQMDITKSLVIDGLLWPPNTVEIRDVLTVGRWFYYQSPQHGQTQLKVTKFTDETCSTIGLDGTRYTDTWKQLQIERVTLI